MATLLGGRIRSFEAQAGTLESDYMAGASFLNPVGHVQCGMLGAMLDDVTAVLVTATLAEGEACATLNFNLSYLRPALPGALKGVARLERRGRDICVVSAELLQDERVVAIATASCKVVTGRAP